ncbi:BhlA/UviB family holin-like peptide [Alteribacter natronophilus]|uniref:BhlA/UviB family holin-like peptide n=1 Tax=Alteribacter natronophilus TaxID=2583810 RepID=UPI0014862718|nr:BhlA/UviB family holin-like peptide [Alteribacter natronophilus]
MWDSLFGYGMQSGVGIFGLLFIVLLGTAVWGVRWVMAMNNEREKRYISVIEQQSESLRELNEIQKDVQEIKEDLKEYLYKKRD